MKQEEKIKIKKLVYPEIKEVSRLKKYLREDP